MASSALAQTAIDDQVIVFEPSFFTAAAPPSAYEMIVRLPGFSFERGTDARGLADSSGNVLIDGRPPVSKNDLLEDILKRIPATSVERIELIRGGALGIDMRGKSVLANVVRKAGGGLRGTLSVDNYAMDHGTLLPGALAESRWSVNEVSFELSLRVGRKPDDQATDGFRRLVGADGTLLSQAPRDAFGQTKQRWITAAAEMPLGMGRLKLNTAWKRSPYESWASEPETTSTSNRDERLHEDPRHLEFGGRYTRPVGESAELELVGFKQWNDTRTDAVNAAGSQTRQLLLDRDTDEEIWRGQLSWDASRRIRLEFGGDAVVNTLVSHTDYSENGILVPIPSANVRVRERRNEVFVQATARPVGSLTLESGIRQEWSEISADGDTSVDKSLAFTKPRVAATWSFPSGSQIRARLAREVDQLSFDDFVASSAFVNTGVVLAGNPDLSPQQAWVAEVAVERRFGDGGAAIFELRHKKLTDVIDRVPVRDLAGNVLADAPGNIGKGEVDEAVVGLTLPLDRLRIKGGEFVSNMTFRHSRVTDPTTGERREISQMYPHEIELRFRQDLPALRTSWGFQIFTAMSEHSYRYSEIEMRKLGFWLTPFVEYAPWRGWLMRAELQSATRGDLERTRYIYDGPRSESDFAYAERRETRWGRSLYINLRRTFGE